uniref:Uncharacterized protein n=1 Tax=Ditylenchus dipsaci TaxID=166011 RepID=A0A915D0N6_9BILA
MVQLNSENQTKLKSRRASRKAMQLYQDLLSPEVTIDIDQCSQEELTEMHSLIYDLLLQQGLDHDVLANVYNLLIPHLDKEEMRCLLLFKKTARSSAKMCPITAQKDLTVMDLNDVYFLLSKGNFKFLLANACPFKKARQTPLMISKLS